MVELVAPFKQRAHLSLPNFLSLAQLKARLSQVQRILSLVTPLNLRSGARGPWLGCSRFPKCRGRGKWSELDDATKAELEKKLEDIERANPIPIITRLDGTALTDKKGKPVSEAPKVEELLLESEPTGTSAA